MGIVKRHFLFLLHDFLEIGGKEIENEMIWSQNVLSKILWQLLGVKKGHFFENRDFRKCGNVKQWRFYTLTVH